jgi:UDP-N-acetylglucosamine diphosphorylase / glucose-1-phosphate thymidylyltransferase / UDP-N-acetylgalactosamine diphosphorylase / glucosamine-1-phosphate N-acetyltransferase / galactosamine-1-phosphate N-acetyltransferase
MRICLFEDAGVSNLQPLTLTRPAFDLRCGAVSLLERQERSLPGRADAALVRSELIDVCRLDHPHLKINEVDWAEDRTEQETVVLVNSRWLAPTERLALPDTGEVGLVGEQVAYVAVPSIQTRELSLSNLNRKLAEWRRMLPQRPAGGHMIDYPWDLVERSGAALDDDYQHWWRKGVPVARGLTISGPVERCLIAHTARIEPMVHIDTTKGPVLIEEGVLVQSFSRIEGPCYLGSETRVISARIHGGSIGPQCRIGGEIEASIVHGYSNKAHEGFLGHSYLGEWVNFGAGTQTSDLRTDYGSVRMMVNGQRIDTGLLKVGSFVGDHTKTSINMLFNTGTMVGVFGQLLTSGELLPRVVPSFCRYTRGRLLESNSLREMFTTAEVMMARRAREWTEAHAELFFTLFEQTSTERRQILRDNEQGRLRRVVFGAGGAHR